MTSPDAVIRSIKFGDSINRGEKEIVMEMEMEDSPQIDLRKKVNSYEKDLIEYYVKIYKSSRKVARALGVSQTTIIRKATRYGINLEG